jgi:hypothetical protein
VSVFSSEARRSAYCGSLALRPRVAPGLLLSEKSLILIKLVLFNSLIGENQIIFITKIILQIIHWKNLIVFESKSRGFLPLTMKPINCLCGVRNYAAQAIPKIDAKGKNTLSGETSYLMVIFLITNDPFSRVRLFTVE